jgi:prevent-host-death family protein
LDYLDTVTDMEKSVNVHDAKTHLSRLLERVEAGEEITLARAGRPVARLVPYVRRSEPRPLGLLKGKIVIHDDFDDPLPEFDEAFG